MPPAVLFVSLATSLDRYVWVDSFQLGMINRPARVVEAAGGKALNAARAASRLGCQAWVVGLVGGRTGRSIEALAEYESWSARWIRSESESKVSTCILDEQTGALTELYEQMYPVEPALWPKVMGAIDEVLRAVPLGAVALSGRSPAGLPSGALAEIVELAHSHGVAAYVDSAGTSLAAAIKARPHVVKVNDVEAAEVSGVPTNTLDSSLAAADVIVGLGAEVAIVTRGPEGAVLASGRGDALRVDVPPVASAFAVGGGDTFMGALVTARQSSLDWTAALAYAAAASLVSVRQLEAAVVDVDDVQQALTQVRVSPIGWTPARPAASTLASSRCSRPE